MESEHGKSIYPANHAHSFLETQLQKLGSWAKSKLPEGLSSSGSIFGGNRQTIFQPRIFLLLQPLAWPRHTFLGMYLPKIWLVLGTAEKWRAGASFNSRSWKRENHQISGKNDLSLAVQHYSDRSLELEQDQRPCSIHIRNEISLFFSRWKNVFL